MLEHIDCPKFHELRMFWVNQTQLNRREFKADFDQELYETVDEIRMIRRGSNQPALVRRCEEIMWKYRAVLAEGDALFEIWWANRTAEDSEREDRPDFGA